jgi:hypothetical protein
MTKLKSKCFFKQLALPQLSADMFCLMKSWQLQGLQVEKYFVNIL